MSVGVRGCFKKKTNAERMFRSRQEIQIAKRQRALAKNFKKNRRSISFSTVLQFCTRKYEMATQGLARERFQNSSISEVQLTSCVKKKKTSLFFSGRLYVRFLHVKLVD